MSLGCLFDLDTLKMSNYWIFVDIYLPVQRVKKVVIHDCCSVTSTSWPSISIHIANDLSRSSALHDLPASIRGLTPAGVVASAPAVRRANPVKVSGCRIVRLAVWLAARRIVLSGDIQALVEVVAIVWHVHLYLTPIGFDWKGNICCVVNDRWKLLLNHQSGKFYNQHIST